MQGIHVNTVEPLHRNASNELRKKYWGYGGVGIALLTGYLLYQRAPPWLSILAVSGSAIATAVGVELSLGKYKKAREFFEQELSDLSYSVSGRTVILEGKKAVTLVGKYHVERGKNSKREYMRWEFLDQKPEPDIVFARDGIYAPAYDFGDYYVVLVPPLNRYYLKIEHDIELDALPDKVIVHQDEGEQEIEFQYVAGKSRDARLEFESHGLKVKIAEVKGIPFQKLVVGAGKTDDVLAIVVNKPLFGGSRYEQDYTDYLLFLEQIDGTFALAKGKLVATLDYPIALDRHAAAPAEFVPTPDGRPVNVVPGARVGDKPSDAEPLERLIENAAEGSDLGVVVDAWKIIK